MVNLSIFLNSFESIPSPLSIFLIALTTLLIWYFRFQLYPGKKLPPGTLGFPFVGESLSFLKAQKEDKTDEWLARRIEKHGPVFKSSLFGSKVVFITGQIGNKFIFGGGDKGIESKLQVSAVKLLGDYSIFELSGQRHKLVRSVMMAFLGAESLQKFIVQMDSFIEHQLLLEIDGADSVQIVRLAKKITFKVTFTLLFGLQEGTETDSLYEDFCVLFTGVWSIPLNLPFTTFGKAMKARIRIQNYIAKLVRERRSGLEEGKINPQDDVISSFVALRDENGEALKEEEIIDNLITLLLGSHDTSSLVVTFLLRHLARDAEVCAKVLEEQKATLEAKKRNDGMVGWSGIQMMKYTWRVVQEVFWASSPTHMDNQHFDEPNKFDPSRFENLKASVPPYVYIPFGAGHRVCPGSEFARTEVLLIIHHMVTKYQWTEMIHDEPVTRNPFP